MADRKKLANGSKGRLDEAFGLFLEFVREKIRKANPANKNAPERKGVALGRAFAQLVDEPSVEHIDALIRFMKKEGLYEKGADEKVPASVAVDPRFGMPPGFTQMYASGNNSDCLIHSFLTAVSKEFRTLDKPSRDEFANVFRRGIFPALPLINCIIEARRGGGGHLQPDFEERLLRHNAFLHEGHVYALSMQFGINLVIFSYSRHFSSEIYGKEYISAIFRECLPPYDGRDFRPTVMIKEDGVHFEPITTPDGAYVVDIDAARALVAINEAHRPRKICPACNYPNSPTANVCYLCGEGIAGEAVIVGPAVVAPIKRIKTCPDCGLDNDVMAPSCVACQRSLKGVPPRGDAPKGHIKVCPSCTLVNEAGEKKCTLCETDLTNVKAEGIPAAAVLGAAPVELVKVCPSCTLANKGDAKKCIVCEADLTKVKANVVGAAAAAAAAPAAAPAPVAVLAAAAAAPAAAKRSCPICTYDNNIGAYECEACGAPLRVRKAKGGGKTRNKKKRSKPSRRRK